MRLSLEGAPLGANFDAAELVAPETP